MLLEDVEHFVDHVTCNSSMIELIINEDIPFDIVYSLFDDLGSGYIITSHAGCNDEGARVPFL